MRNSIKMRNLILSCCTILLLAGNSSVALAQNKGHFNKETIDSVLETFDHSARLPGYALCIVQNGEVIYTAQRGKASIDENIKITQSTQFNIGSLTKQFTGTAILLLAESGKLKLSDEIHTYIPELPVFAAPITIEQLLHHTSGIRDHVELATLISEEKDELNEMDNMLKWLLKYPALNTTPGTSFAYSHTGYMLLALIIERTSGISYAEFLQANIFTPLGMKNTYVQTEKNSVLRDGTTHYELNYAQTKAKKADASTNPIGASGVISTTADLAIWDANFYHNKLGKGSQKLIEGIKKSGTLTDGTDVHYGAGLLVKTYRNKNIIEHSGGQGEYLNLYRRFEDENISIIVCMNSYLISPFNICDAISNNIMDYKAIHWLVQKSAPDSILNNITGIYAAENNLVRYVYRKKDKVYIARIFDGDTTAFALNYNGVTANGAYAFVDSLGSSVLFKMENKNVVGLNWDGGTYFVTDRYYTKENTETPPNIFSFAGKYYCPELDKKIRIAYFSKKDELTIHPFPFISYDLISMGGSIYVVKDQPYIVNFNKGELTMGNDWIYNINYIKKVKPKKVKEEKPAKDKKGLFNNNK